ncbi:outer membrane protein [Pacificimonas sp. ICDLI1SI03]
MVKILVATSLLAISTMASAQARIEARAGFDNIGLEEDYSGSDSYSGSEGETGIGYGAEIGYDIALGSSFIGAYANIDFSNVEHCFDDVGLPGTCLSADHSIGLGGRFGIGSADALRGYLKLGYVIGELTGSIGEISESDSRGGLQVGAGAEYPFGPNAYGKLEVVYSDFSDETLRDVYEFDDELKFGFNRTQVMAGIGLRF